MDEIKVVPDFEDGALEVDAESDDRFIAELIKITELLTQIRDGLGATKDAVIAQDIKPVGVTLGGPDNAGDIIKERSTGLSGQGRLSNNIKI